MLYFVSKLTQSISPPAVRSRWGKNHAARGGRSFPLPAQEILEICREDCNGNRREDITQLWWGMQKTREKLLEEFQRVKHREEERRGSYS